MNSASAIPINASRPKIHRLPARSKALPKKRLFVKPFLAAFVFILVLAATRISGLAALPPKDALPPAAKANEASSLMVQKKASSIILTSNSDRIVGQLAKMPSEAEQGPDTKIVSDIDNRAGRDLLSILSQY